MGFPNLSIFLRNFDELDVSRVPALPRLQDQLVCFLIVFRLLVLSASASLSNLIISFLTLNFFNFFLNLCFTQLCLLLLLALIVSIAPGLDSVSTKFMAVWLDSKIGAWQTGNVGGWTFRWQCGCTFRWERENVVGWTFRRECGKIFVGNSVGSVVGRGNVAGSTVR